MVPVCSRYSLVTLPRLPTSALRPASPAIFFITSPYFMFWKVRTWVPRVSLYAGSSTITESIGTSSSLWSRSTPVTVPRKSCLPPTTPMITSLPRPKLPVVAATYPGSRKRSVARPTNPTDRSTRSDTSCSSSRALNAVPSNFTSGAVVSTLAAIRHRPCAAR